MGLDYYQNEATSYFLQHGGSHFSHPVSMSCFLVKYRVIYKWRTEMLRTAKVVIFRAHMNIFLIILTAKRMDLDTSSR